MEMERHITINYIFLVIIGFSCISFVQGQNYQEPCFQPDQPCDAIAGLYCSTTGICECQFPWMVFHQVRRLCQVSAGHECDVDSNLVCTDNSSCVSGDDGEKTECVCDEDFEPCAAPVDDLSGTDVAVDARPSVCCVRNSSEEN
ncbi:unnamed protein product [Orchesella dallaii]|uniref:EB domain-containing protein n=1 Tax=Orchesella dallaii TaxID=48710 RepID=A0ABP1S2W3_9HEXA